jgi:hypothetical protein
MIRRTGSGKGVPTTHAEKLASPMTLNFKEFEDFSFLAA